MSTSYIQYLASGLNLAFLSRNSDRHLIIAAAAVAGLPLAVYLVSSYRSWLDLHAGGLPANPVGYFFNLALQLFARRDIRAPAPYTLENLEVVYGAVSRRSFLEPSGTFPAERVGSRPIVLSYVAPQRQTSGCAAGSMRKRMEIFLAAVVLANPNVIEMRPSRLEGPSHHAVWLAESVATRPTFMKGTRGELIHVHREGSTHMVLSLMDVTRAIKLFWAERHPLSGGPEGFIPWNYVLFYAPRSEEEFVVWKTFVAASLRFNSAATVGLSITVPLSLWGITP
ncbi:hypothetical protein F4810DRAFT_627987 [Camillea tinctor]|nr:hypothetical protein F4810DRAFT_627987 [Camillea tinctor]